MYKTIQKMWPNANSKLSHTNRELDISLHFDNIVIGCLENFKQMYLRTS